MYFLPICRFVVVEDAWRRKNRHISGRRFFFVPEVRCHKLPIREGKVCGSLIRGQKFIIDYNVTYVYCSDLSIFESLRAVTINSIFWYVTP